ncbi:hypothetical protein [Coxiella-like endosymbiont]|uniref:hypothetical protein n=1 Tax=Coxiella-like endosymbiont TaxID=1592897 RepID=UPI00272C2C3F|nr:hypothetical protein [Coxiella-like endosymbiont]
MHAHLKLEAYPHQEAHQQNEYYQNDCGNYEELREWISCISDFAQCLSLIVL